MFDGNNINASMIWCPWKICDVLCVCCAQATGWMSLFSMNELERVLSSWTKWQACIEKQQHSRYWRNLFLCWGLIWTHSRIFIVFDGFPHISWYYWFQISLAFFTKAICRKTRCKPFASFETQERACELLLQGGGGPEVFSKNFSKGRSGVCDVFCFCSLVQRPVVWDSNRGTQKKSQSLSFSGIL